MGPRASIIINNHNYARFLRQAIESALDQTCPDVEVVVVDDGSTDESPEVIRSYGEKVRAVFKENGGQASAFNAGFAAARGEIVTFLDADDYFAPDALAAILQAWHDDTKILYHRLREVDAGGHELGYNPPIDDRIDAGEAVPILLQRGSLVAPPTSGQVYRRDLLQQILPMPEAEFRICADTYLAVAACFLAPVTTMEGTVAYYRVHGANAHRETAQRRKWPLRKLAVAQANVAQRHALIREFAVRQGRPEPEPGRWISGADLFERLLLRRAAPTVKEAWDTSLAAVWTKTWSEAGVRPGLRLRTIVLAVVVAAAPRFLLRRLYPNLF